MLAVILGPYRTGAVTPSGAVPQVVAPQPQRRAISWCSVTCTVSGGRSNTCRRCMPTSGASRRSAPQPVHRSGSCRFRSPGSSTSANVDPGCPGWPPRRRPLFRRSDLGAGWTNGESDDGGFEEFRLFCPSRRLTSATSASSRSIRSACRTTRAASSSQDGRGSAGTTPGSTTPTARQHATPVRSHKPHQSHRRPSKPGDLTSYTGQTPDVTEPWPADAPAGATMVARERHRRATFPCAEPAPCGAQR